MNGVEEVKKIIRSLLVSAPVKVTVASLNRDYKSLEGYNIPYKELGYNCLLHFLRDIPDILKVNGSSNESEISVVVSEKTAHVNDMVLKQKKPSKGKSAHLSRKSVISSFVKNNLNNKGNLISKCDFQKNDSCPKDDKVDNLITLPGKSVITNIVQNSNNNNNNRKDLTTRSDFHNKDALTKHVPVEVHDRVPPLVCERNISSNELPTEEVKRKENNTQSKLMRLMHSKKLSNSYNKATKLEVNNSNNIVISFQNDVHPILNINNEKSTRIPVEIERNLQNLISTHPNGLFCTELIIEYEKLYKSNLNYQKYGFGSILDLCIRLENIFRYEKYSECDFKLFDKTKHIKTDDSKEKSFKHISNAVLIDPFSIKPVKSKDWEIYSEFIPDGILNLGEEIKNDVVIRTFVVGDIIPVVVSEIINPSKFWVYKDNGVLNNYMNTMQNFYRENEAKYFIPEFLLEEGLYCVVNTMNEFQRGLIVDLLPNIGGKVKVYLIDYGTQLTLPKEKICFLNKNFSDIPAQAVQANLGGVRPVGEHWSSESCIRFKDFLSCKHVLAKICDNDSQCITIYIAEKRSQPMFINKLLIEEGYGARTNSKNCSDNTETTPKINSIKMKLMKRIIREG